MGKIITTPERSRIMRKVRRENTGPEVLLRKALYSQGLRYRIHAKNLPGTPDLVLSKYRVVIFVHGCFWHRHSGCRQASTPKENADFWISKFRRNQERDLHNELELKKLGWKVITIWECELRSKYLAATIESLLKELVEA